MDFETVKKELNETLATKGYKPGELQMAFRNGFYDASLVELAIVDALINEGGMVAWRGDGVSCVAQMIRPTSYRWSFVQDDDCHWYMIPADRKEAFDEWVNHTLIREVCSREELINMGINPDVSFNRFRIDGVEQYSFASPEKEK